MNQFKLIYSKLYNFFGPQNWWPVTVKGVKPKYSGGPKNNRHVLEVIFGAILTQYMTSC